MRQSFLTGDKDLCAGTPVTGTFLFILMPYDIVKQGVMFVQSIEKVPFFNAGTPIAYTETITSVFCTL
jgi:hypothetical protein